MGSNPMKSIMLVQVSMGDYRDEFVRELVQSTAQRYELTLMVGDQYFGGTTKTSEFIKQMPCRVRPVNILLGSSLGLQLFNYWKAIRSDVLVLELNPRLVHTWLLLLIRKPSSRKTVLWGHVWARSGPGSKTEVVRAVLRNLADRLLFYTEEQKQAQLRTLGQATSDRIFVAANSLYMRKEMYAAPPLGGDFIYVGRLVADKKPVLLVQAFISVVEELASEVCLHIVGAGPLTDDIVELIDRAELKDRIIMHGHVGEYERLRPLYDRSLFSVSPGYVGLSAIQSLSFGRPMLVSRDEPHAPEICALSDGQNCCFFDTDNADALGQAMVAVSVDHKAWVARFDQIAENCSQQFSVETMVEGFVNAVED